ncbi:MAG: DNA-directed RNA polymerase subunit omega [Clostridia bacterium]|nr:DNA-directed RNA polymerase subunit omega [Clostridia bacterium]
MLNPAIGKLIEKHNDRYSLVLEVAKRAREIAKEAEEREEILVEKPVSIAINMLANEEELDTKE